MVVMPGSFPQFASGAEEHPRGEGENADSGADLQIRLDAFRIPLAAKVKRGGGEHPNDERM
jgi:hypothetical protein